MTGTSMDGIDISFVKTNGVNLKRLNQNYFYEYDNKTKTFLSKLLENSVRNNLINKIKLDNLITFEHYKALKDLHVTEKADIIGFHGQTIYHNPSKMLSVQLGDPKLLSKLLKKNVIFNFRSNDIKMGGQGAPLAPIYHKYIIESANLDLPSCILNIGGVANLTYWDGNSLIGFDTGPGNAFMDDLVRYTSNQYFDKDGYIASKGFPDTKIVKQFLSNSYFKLLPPKSLDRNTFVNMYKQVLKLDLSIEDKMSTLNLLTTESIVLSIKQLPKKLKNIIVTGGGNKNFNLIRGLEEKLKVKFITENDININFDFIESELIAYLSARSIYSLPFTFPTTTGVSTPLSGGKVFGNYKKPC